MIFTGMVSTLFIELQAKITKLDLIVVYKAEQAIRHLNLVIDT